MTKQSQWQPFSQACFRRTVFLLLVMAFLSVAAIGCLGMGLSVLEAETVQGSGSAINVAGSLRRLTHRIGALVMVSGFGGNIGKEKVEQAVVQLDETLQHPALLRVFEREHNKRAQITYQQASSTWQQQLRAHVLMLAGEPLNTTAPYQHEQLLGEIDEFVELLNTFVMELEQDTEKRIKRLRQTLGWALILSIGLMLLFFYLLRQRVFRPLTDLVGVAGRIARRDFSARCQHSGEDELGQVSTAFNAMADELSASYQDLECRVREKTLDLMRSNRSLELLYHVITRLYHAPESTDSYTESLQDLERILELKGSFVCVASKHGGTARVLVSTIRSGCNGNEGVSTCDACLEGQQAWQYHCEGESEILMVPLRDNEKLYGMLRLSMRRGRRLETWQQALIEAVSRHMGIAIGISQQSERDRLLALQEERSIIARELHDSLAQSLSYMKIQISLLAPLLGTAANQQEARAIVTELREGVSSAYRQLRELLSSFRLRVEGDFTELLEHTAEEFAARSGMKVVLDIQLDDCHLRPNQEIHVLHIIREALSNAARHSGGNRIIIALHAQPDGEVRVTVEDDGQGAPPSLPLADSGHYGMAIMAERARGLGGIFALERAEGGGARISVRFDPQQQPETYRVFSLEQLS